MAASKALDRHLIKATSRLSPDGYAEAGADVAVARRSEPIETLSLSKRRRKVALTRPVRLSGVSVTPIFSQALPADNQNPIAVSRTHPAKALCR